MLLFHIFVILNINEYQQECIDSFPLSRDNYIALLHRCTTQGEIELDGSMRHLSGEISVLFRLFHSRMLLS